VTVTSTVEIPPGARGLVREACLCGIDVVSQGSSGQEITEAVQRHRVEPVHERWAALQGFRGPLAEQVALMQMADEMAVEAGRSAVDVAYRGIVATRQRHLEGTL
jgi:hypothetical protein